MTMIPCPTVPRVVPALAGVAVFLAVLVVQPAAAQVTYTYTGADFTTADPPYTTDDHLAGSFSVAIPLQPFLVNEAIDHLVLDFSFTDGQQTRLPANSALCGFTVSTDGAGRLTKWTLTLRQTGVAEGNPQQVIDSSNFGDQVGIGPAGTSPCDSINLTTAAGSAIAGSWSDTLPPGFPTTYTYDGSLFTSVTPPYTTADRLAGWFVLDNPLPVLMSSLDLRNALTDFSFTDGTQTRVPANTEVCSFEVTTNGAGHIIDWTLGLRQVPFTSGNPQQTIDSSSFGDLVGSGPAGSFACDSIELTAEAVADLAGSWSDALPPGSVTDYDYLGEAFSFAQPPYEMTDRVTGFVRFANPLPPFLASEDVAFALEDIAYEDGVQSRDAGNSTVCRFRATTDGNGNIIGWSLSLREEPHMEGQLQGLIDSNQFGDQGGNAVAVADPCGNLMASTIGFNVEAGNWSAPIAASEPVVYLYSGSSYITADPPYQVGQKLYGRITTPGSLPPLMPLTDIGEHIISYAFRDHVQVRNAANSFICQMMVSTDANGDIVQWQISLREPAAMDADQQSIQTDYLGLREIDLCGSGAAGPDFCSRRSLDVRASAILAGQWHRFCPEQLAAVPDWPEPVDVLDILALSCP